MIHLTVPVRTETSAEYARMQSYFWSSSKSIPITKRPILLILPGGAYERTSDREAEPVAARFFSMGFHTAVLRYSVAPYVYPTSLKETSMAVKWLMDHSAEYGIDMDRFFLMGFSAGGHLAAMYSVRKSFADWNMETIRPTGTILCYPVISSDPHITHAGSLENLLGCPPDTFPDQDAVSPERMVDETTPKTFLWTTYTDETVPCENSFRYFEALRAHQVPAELHCFSVGSHGLSLANELSDNLDHQKCEEDVQIWTVLCENWIRRICAECEVKTQESPCNPSGTEDAGTIPAAPESRTDTAGQKPFISAQVLTEEASAEASLTEEVPENPGNFQPDLYDAALFDTADTEELIHLGMTLFRDVQDRMRKIPNLDLTCGMQLKSDLKNLEKAVRLYRKNPSQARRDKIRNACLTLQTSAYHILRDSFDDGETISW